MANANRDGTKSSTHLLFALYSCFDWAGLYFNTIFMIVVGKVSLRLHFSDIFSTRPTIKVLNFGTIPSCSY